jgi:asparagine synthase (glutamine-hydrolysing)
MPGIAGLVTRKPRDWAQRQLGSMIDFLLHEPFYVNGTWCDESLGVYAGWVAIKGGFAEGMPLRDARGDVTLLFSGEEYPDPGVIRRLQDVGCKCEAGGTSHLVHLCEESEFPRNLNGMFHGLVADRRRGTVSLFNDRFGMHRLYYSEMEDGFYFSCEAKAILAVRPDLREMDTRSFAEFVALSCVLENRTLFRNIHVLPAASRWTFRIGSSIRRETYFKPQEWEEQESLSGGAYFRELRDTVSSILPRYFSGPQQVGMAVTGGLDTRVILAQYPTAPDTLKTYTFAGPLRESEDVCIGRKVAAVCRQPYEVITVSDEFLRKFSDYARRSIHLTEGTVDVYRSADLYLSEKVRGIAPVKIVGTYGSEILRHAVMFKPADPPADVLTGDVLSQIKVAGETYAALRKDHPVTFAAFRQSPWYHFGILATEKSQLTVRSPFMDNEFVRTVYRAPKEETAGEDLRPLLIRDGNAELAKLRSDRGVGGNGGPLLSALRRAYLEFTFKAEYAYDYGMPQSVSRIDHCLSQLRLERLFLGRHKLLHFRVWYRDQLADYVRQMLLDSTTLSRPYLNRKSVEAIVKGHLEGGQNYTTAIHKLLTLELIHRLFVDRTVCLS